jgi:hypothetical protein
MVKFRQLTIASLNACDTILLNSCSKTLTFCWKRNVPMNLTSYHARRSFFALHLRGPATVAYYKSGLYEYAYQNNIHVCSFKLLLLNIYLI